MTLSEVTIRYLQSQIEMDMLTMHHNHLTQVNTGMAISGWILLLVAIMVKICNRCLLASTDMKTLLRPLQENQYKLLEDPLLAQVSGTICKE